MASNSRWRIWNSWWNGTLQGNRSTRRKPTPVLLHWRQNPHNPTWDRTQAAAVGNRRLRKRQITRQDGGNKISSLQPAWANLRCYWRWRFFCRRVAMKCAHRTFQLSAILSEYECNTTNKNYETLNTHIYIMYFSKYVHINTVRFIPVSPTWSIGHPWNPSFHFSFLI
jgi:hypothetical protein